jgi:hypothetical protein
LENIITVAERPWPRLAPLKHRTEGRVSGGFMHRDDLMKSDLLSQIVLLASGIVLFAPLLLLVLLAVSQSVRLP